MIMGARGLGQVPTGAASGGATGVPQLSNEQWYELIALASNQPLANMQSYYGQTATGSNISNLAVALGQWPGGIAHSGYAMYQQGAIVDAPAGGHYYQYGPRGASWASTGAVNKWAIPSTAVQASSPTTSTVQSTAATSVQAGTDTSFMGAPYTGATTTTAATTNGGTTATGFLTTAENFLTGSMIGGIPNWMLLGGGVAVLFLFMQHGSRR